MDPTAEDLRRVRTWLDREPIRYAHVIRLLSLPASQVQVWIDDPRRPRAVLAIRLNSQRLAAAAEPPEKVNPLLDLVPRGAYRLTSVDVELVPHFQGALKATFRTPVWLYRMDPQDLRPSRVAETRPVQPSEAPMIAALWAPERDAVEYVRRRIEEGITSGIEIDGELVAWDMTHFETDRVVMLGFLHVKEGHRGRGYAKTVTTATAEKAYAKGKIAAAEVFKDNLPSLQLTEGMGFQRVKQQVWGEGIKG